MVTTQRARAFFDAPNMLVAGLLALVVGLATTMFGAWFAYWRSVTVLDGFVTPEPDRLALYLVVAGGIVAMIGALAIYRSQDS